MRIEYNNGDEEIINIDRVDRIEIPKGKDMAVFYFSKEKVTYNKADLDKSSWDRLNLDLASRL